MVINQSLMLELECSWTRVVDGIAALNSERVVYVTSLDGVKKHFIPYERSILPPLPVQSAQLPGYSPTLAQPASRAIPAAARLRTPALQ